MNHQDLQVLLLKAATKCNATLYVSRRGFGWVGQLLDKTAKFVTLTNARRIEIGLVNGSSDLVGVTRVVVTPQMVGRTVAVFTSVEVKVGKDKLSPDQKRWLANVRRWGGIAVECRSTDDLRLAIEEFRDGRGFVDGAEFLKPPD